MTVHIIDFIALKVVGLMVLGNSNVIVGQTFLLAIFKGQNDMILLLQRVFLYLKKDKRAKIKSPLAKLKASAGHIWPANLLLNICKAYE